MKQYIQNNVNKTLIDAIFAMVAFCVTYEFLFNSLVLESNRTQELWLILLLGAARVLVGLAWGLGRQKWRYFDQADVAPILYTHATIALMLLALRFAAPLGTPVRVPLEVIVLQLFLSLTGSLGVRIFWRAICERNAKSNQPENGGVRNVLVLGAGFHGITVAREMGGFKDTRVVGFLDEDRHKVGKVIAGFPVVGSLDSLPEVIKRHAVDEVLVCLPPSVRSRAALSRLADSPDVRLRDIPSFRELIEQDDHASKRQNGLVKKPLVSVPRSHVIAPFRNKKILITGGAGFIGSSLAERLVKDNQVVLFDQSFSGQPVQYSSLLSHPNVETMVGDILNEKDLTAACRGVDMVVHAAAILGVGKVCNASRLTLETNYVGTSCLLKVLEQNDHLERFVYFSTSEVFGVNSFRVDESTSPSVGPIAESRWSYSISKLAGEHLVKSYYRETKMPITIVRPFNVFGPRRKGDYALRRFIINALTGQPLEIHGDGSQIRAWCFIDDFCDAILAMMSRPEAIGEDFNIGNPANTVTVMDLARDVIEMVGSSSPIRLIDHPFPDISIRVPSLAKAHTLLNYNPRVDLASGLAYTIEWHNREEVLPNRSEELSIAVAQ